MIAGKCYNLPSFEIVDCGSMVIIETREIPDWYFVTVESGILVPFLFFPFLCMYVLKLWTKLKQRK